MSHDTIVSRASAAPARRSERSGRWVYLLAVLFPGWQSLDAILSPFPIYGYEPWLSAALVAVCLFQFYRPTVLLGVAVLLWYAWTSAQVLWWEVGAFQDYLAYGGEDHDRWEGWQTAWIVLVFTIFLLTVTVRVALHTLRRARHAT